MLLLVRAAVVRAGGVVLAPLINALGQVGAQDVFVLANAIGDSNLFDPVPDFVVGVLSPLAGESQGQGLTNLDVILRVGRSVERDLPTLLIVPPPLPALAPTAGLAFAYCPTDSDAALYFHLSALVATVSSESQRLPEQRSKPATSDPASVAEYLSGGPELSPNAFEELLRNLFQSVGAETIVSQRTPNDTGVDLVVTPAEAPNNLVFIQAKAGRVSERSLSSLEGQLQNIVLENRANLGLLVYYDREGTEFAPRSSTPLVISFSLKSLAQLLATQSLVQVLNSAAAGEPGGTPP
jgi:Restriction endonuclease